MNVRYIKLPQTDELISYLRESERLVDLCTDEELDRLEKDLETRIKTLVEPTASIIPLKPRSKNNLWKNASYTGLLMAAMALLFIRNSNVTPENQMQTKGLSETSSNCGLMIVQSDRTTLEAGDRGYEISGKLPVYLRSDCEGRLELEAFRNGDWTKVRVLKTYDGYVGSNNDLLDLRDFSGERLRLHGSKVLSEEFTIIKAP